jgi:protein-S-isoprenylcysteine O-methyltransferase Ste14
MKYFMLIILWSLWCALHSALISTTVTEYLARRMGPPFRFYRLIYNIFSFLTLIPVVLYGLSLKGEPFFAWQGPWRIGQIFLLAAAGALFIAGSRHYSPGQFLGINQIKEGNTCNALGEDCEVQTTGVLGVVRHPWYTGAILLIWARPWNSAAFLTNILLTAYLVIGTYLEERKLVLGFGEPYKDYQRRVSMFVPWKWIQSKTRSRLSWKK